MRLVFGPGWAGKSKSTVCLVQMMFLGPYRLTKPPRAKNRVSADRITGLPAFFVVVMPLKASRRSQRPNQQTQH
jgi:hypothetical protein